MGVCCRTKTFCGGGTKSSVFEPSSERGERTYPRLRNYFHPVLKFLFRFDTDVTGIIGHVLEMSARENRFEPKDEGRRRLHFVHELRLDEVHFEQGKLAEDHEIFWL